MTSWKQRLARHVDMNLLLGIVNLVLSLPVRRLRLLVVRRLLGWEMGSDVWIGRRLRVHCFGGVVVGSRVVINRRAEIDGRGGLTIGDDVAFAPGVTIFTADHDPDSPVREYRERTVIVGDRVWLASGVTVLPGTNLAEGVVLGAGAVASGRLQPWTIYAGNPALPRRPRSVDAQRRLEARLPRWL